MNELIKLYRDMLRIRLIEEAIADRYPEQKMRCPTHLSIGQEATPVALSALLSNEDKAYSSHRAHAHYLAKGGNLNKLIAELYGKKTGCTSGRGGSMHLTDLRCGFMASTAIVANSIPVAVGHALHLQSQNEGHVAIAYFGDGAVEEGAFYESANFAAVRKLPMIFVCENNYYSVYSNLEARQPANRKIYRMVQSMGVNARHFDGNNVYTMYQEFGDLIRAVREGNGPLFIECDTYRHREHCGPNFDDHLNYRPEQQLAEWLDRDPLQIALTRIQNLHNKPFDNFEMERQIKTEINTAFDLAEEAEFCDPTENSERLYA